MNFSIECTKQIADLGEVQIHYLRAGSNTGAAVLLIHGWPQTSIVWASVAPLLSDYDLIMPDMRGLGDSSIPPGGYDKKTIAADIIRLVDKIGIKKLFVVGHDWGTFAEQCCTSNLYFVIKTSLHCDILARLKG